MADDLRHQLERAAERLDVHPPGLGAAVTRARRRRRTSSVVGVLAAAAVLTGGVLVVPGLLAEQDDELRPASGVGPPPRQAQASAVTAASTGLPPLIGDVRMLDLSGLQVLPDDRTLAVTVLYGCPDIGPPRVQEVQTPTQVSVRVVVTTRQLGPGEVCSLGESGSALTMPLDAPLGSRRLVVQDEQGPREVVPPWRGRLLDVPPGLRRTSVVVLDSDLAGDTVRRSFVRAATTCDLEQAEASAELEQTMPGSVFLEGEPSGRLIRTVDVQGDEAVLRDTDNGLELSWVSPVGPVTLRGSACESNPAWTPDELIELARSLTLPSGVPIAPSEPVPPAETGAALWARVGEPGYSYELVITDRANPQSARIAVRNGAVVDVEPLGFGELAEGRTITELLAVIEADPEARQEVTHDPVFGYPTRATDRQGGPEGELLTTYEVRSYRPLP